MHADDQPPQATDYRLDSRGGKTVVRVVTSGFPTDAAWDEWVQGTVDGWAFELRSLKEYLERHAGEDREVVYLRRRVPLSSEEIWSRLAAPGALGSRPLGAEPILESPPRQWAATVRRLDGALLRAGSDPCGTQVPGERDVTLWLSAWGDARKGLRSIREDWEGMLELLRIVAFTPTANMTGQPAIALPTGLDPDGHPVSVHLVGRPADEATVLRVAAQLEAVLPQLPRPPVS